jgi:dipeptidyl aminopeptidase/acylaminoacyl peptidase
MKDAKFFSTFCKRFQGENTKMMQFRVPMLIRDLKAFSFRGQYKSASVLTWKQLLVLILCYAAIASTHASASHDPKKPFKQYTIEDFLAITNYDGLSFSPDNSSILVSSDESGVYNAFAVPLKGGEPEQLTNSSKESIFVIDYFPDDERFLYMADQGGNELSHIYVREVNGATKDLTPGAKLKAAFYGWAQDDKSFYAGTNERDPRYFDVYEYRISGYSREMIFRNDAGYIFADVSPDGHTIALSKVKSRDDSDIFLYDRKTKELRHLTPHEGEANHKPQAFSFDGKTLYYLTDAGSEFLYLVSQDLATGERRVIKKTNWDISFAQRSKHGKYLMLGVNQNARTTLHIYETGTMKPVELPQAPHSSITSVQMARDEDRLALYTTSGRMPKDLFYYDLSSPEPRKLTRSLSPNIEPMDLVEGEIVRFKSFDGIEISGILYKPHRASPVEKAPTLIWVHGGPGAQSRIGFHALTQYLVNHEYVVYAINNRGSTGYGKSFQRLDDRKHGEGDLDDCVSAKRMLVATGYVDADRIGIIGRSYGGYMVLAALTFRPEAFHVGVDIAGISNWYRTVQSMPLWWESQRAALQKEMGAFDNKKYLHSISPLFHAERITKPLMVLQGANDPRVLEEESDEIVADVRKKGVPVEYLVFEDEGHWFRKKKNQERAYREILIFLNKYLKDGKPE